MATGTQYSAWSAYKLPSGASAKRRVRTYYTWTTSETPTTFSIAIKAYGQMQGGSATMDGNTITVSATGQSSVSNTFEFVYGETTLHNPVNKTYTWEKTTAAQTVTVKSTYKVASGRLFAGTYVASGTFTIPALAPATITFDANGGSGTVPSAISTYIGVANTIPSNSLTRTGYTFNSWNTASDGSGTAYATGSTITPTGNVTLYAQWKTTYVKPEIQNLLAFRTANASGGATPTVTSTGTTGFCKFQLVGGANYTFTSATVQFGTATAKSMTKSGTTAYGYSTVGSIAQTSAYTVKVTVVVTGTDGISRTYTDSTYISKAVPVYDATPNSFALGGVARDVTGDEKPFDCYMHPIFYTMAGEIKMWAGDAIPDGWLLCDGSEVSKTTYPNLYAAIGDSWGVPNSSSNFKLPNLKGRVPVGYDSADVDFDTVGDVGGEKTHLLTESEMPSHKHFLNYNVVYEVGGSLRGSKGTYYGWSLTKPTTNNTGGGQAHNNMQPYAVIKYIICAI